VNIGTKPSEDIMTKTIVLLFVLSLPLSIFGQAGNGKIDCSTEGDQLNPACVQTVLKNSSPTLPNLGKIPPAPPAQTTPVTLVPQPPPFKATCRDAGTAVFCSNGLSAIRSGNTMYFSDGTSAMTSGNTVFIQSPSQAQPQPVPITQSDSYEAGQAIGNMVLGVIGLVQEVKQQNKLADWCYVHPYSRVWLRGGPAFCSKAAILDACSNVASFDFSGYKYPLDSPHHIAWSGEDHLYYNPSWPHGSRGEVRCVPDEAGHAVHNAKLWLFYKQEASYYLRNSHPNLSDDDSIRIVNYIYTHPRDYKYINPADHQFELKKTQLYQKLYSSAKATS
jgi:hypothetical protein